MKQDEIKGKTYEVSILRKGINGDTLCFKLKNDELGEFDMDNCHYNADPARFPNAKYCLNGNVVIITEEGENSFVAVLEIDQNDSDRGKVTLRC